MKNVFEKAVEILKLSYYGKHDWLKRTSYLLLCGAIYLACYTYDPQSPFFSKHLGWVLLVITIVIPVKEFLVFNAHTELGKTKNELEAQYKERLIKKLLGLLLSFYQYKHNVRITLFIPTMRGDEEIIRPYTRVEIGRGFDSSVEEKPCFFRKGEGLPGIAWSKAFPIKDNISALLESIQVDHVPEEALQNEEALKAYYKEAYSMNNVIYDSLGSSKKRIKSYLSIGFLTDDNLLGGVISIDSQNENEFIDLENIKKNSKKSLHTIQKQITGVYSGTYQEGAHPPEPLRSFMAMVDNAMQGMPNITSEIKDLPKEADSDTIIETKKKMKMVAAFGASFEKRFASDVVRILYPLRKIVCEIERTMREG